MEWIAIAIVAVVAFGLGFGAGKSRRNGGNDDFPLHGVTRTGSTTAPVPAATKSSAGPRVTPGELPAAVMDEVTEMLLHGNKIEAIKAYRKQTGCGLKEAKDAVEAIQRQMSRPPGPA